MDVSRRQDSEPRVYTGSKFDGTRLSLKLLSERPFGVGGSAKIFKGETLGDVPLAVAVKVFNEGELEKQLLARELGTVSQVSLRHKSILPFLGTVDWGDQKAIVSLYMRNGNLLEYFKSHPGCHKKRLILQVADAVNYLHTTKNLVHGDLKCANVLVSDSGEALLGDFGLSTSVPNAQAKDATTTRIRQMNTSQFAAPELWVFGDPTIKPPSKTYASDVYAYGMLVLQALTEKLPWPGANDSAVILLLHSGKRPPRPTSTGFSQSWWDVCQRCWSHSPVGRPPMHEVLTTLTHSSLDLYRQLDGHSARVNSVAYFPGGHRVVSGSDDGSICTWDTLTCTKEIFPFLGHQSAVLYVAVSANGRQICSGGKDHTIRLWDAESGAQIGKPMTGHTAAVDSVAFSPDSTRIVSCSDDRTVRLWDAATGDALGDPLVGHTDEVWSVAFSPDGANIASGSRDGTIRLWDSTTGGSLGFLPHDQSMVPTVCFLPDRIHIVSGDAKGIVRIWHISTRQLARKLPGRSWVRSLVVSPSGGHIASGSNDATIRIWDAHTGDAVRVPLTGHKGSINSIAFSPNGRSLVSAADDGTLRIWDLFE